MQNHKHGGKTYLICASHGERGVSHLKRPTTPAKLAARRKRELTAAARFLKIDKLTLLKLPDGGVAKHTSELYKTCLATARALKADYLMSFGPDGITGHVDHIAVGEVAERVARELKLPLICFALPPRVHKHALTWFTSRRAAGYYMNDVTFAKPNLRLAIDGTQKKQALAFHASQMDERTSFSGFPSYAVDELLKAEHFKLK